MVALDHQGQLQWHTTIDGNTPFEPVVTADGDIVLVIERGSARQLWLTKINQTGEISSEYNLGYADRLTVPVALSADNHLYLATYNNRLIKVDLLGQVQWNKQLSGRIVNNIVIDSQINAYFVDTLDDIYRVNVDGQIDMMIGDDDDISPLILGQVNDQNGVREVLIYTSEIKGLVVVGGDGKQQLINRNYRSNARFVIGHDNNLLGGFDYTSRLKSIALDVDGYAVDSWSALGGNSLSQGRIDYVNGYPDIDTDGDGITDEIDNCVNDYNPSQLNTDGADDGGNACDSDDDNDGVNDEDDAFPLDASESVDTDGDSIGNNADTDDDGDGMSDSWEVANGLDSLNADDASLDNDSDGYTNLEEYRAASDPNDVTSIPSPLGVETLNLILQLLDEDKQQQPLKLKDDEIANQL